MFERYLLVGTVAILFIPTTSGCGNGGGGGSGRADAEQTLVRDAAAPDASFSSRDAAIEAGADAGLAGLDAGEGAGDSGTPYIDAGVAPQVLTVVDALAVSNLVIDAANLYWVEVYETFFLSPGCRIRVQAMPKAGGPPTTLATFIGSEWFLTTDGHSLYIAIQTSAGECEHPICGSPFSLFRIFKSAAEPTRLGYCTPKPFSSDGQNVYCIGELGPTYENGSPLSGGLLRVPLTGQAPTLLAPSEGAMLAVTDWGLDVLWGAGELNPAPLKTALKRVPKAGGSPVTLFEREDLEFARQSPQMPIKADYKFIYFAANEILRQGLHEERRLALFAVPRLGGQVTKLRAQERPFTGLDAHGDYVYWTDESCLGRIKNDGTGPVCLDAGKPMASVRVDDSAIYYIRNRGTDAQGRLLGDEIVRMPKPAPLP